MAIQVVVLAAGLGKRMHSHLPKVLHPLAGKPLLQHIISTALVISEARQPIVVHGHQGSLLKETIAHDQVQWVEQKEQLGTAHAVQQALPHIADQDEVLILYGDVPLISVPTLQKLITTTPPAALGMLTAHLDNPLGYGRVLRDDHQQVIGIIEEKDAAPEQLQLTEINPGIYFVPAVLLKKWLPQLKNHNAQKEYYLTDMITRAVADKVTVHTVTPAVIEEILGVNDRSQLHDLERYYQRQWAEKLMQQGVTLSNADSLNIRGDVQIGRDVTIDINVILEGVVIGDECVIGPHVVLRDAVLGDKVQVKANSVIEGANIGPECLIGPFARIRPETVLGKRAHIGNFVEVKKSTIKDGSKVNHLSYIGDSEIGERANIGAGTITCNYDGVAKHKTFIGDEVFIGSCTQLVAPVTIGEGATIGAGSTITKDAPPHQLTLSRAPQVTVKQWVRKTTPPKI